MIKRGELVGWLGLVFLFHPLVACGSHDGSDAGTSAKAASPSDSASPLQAKEAYEAAVKLEKRTPKPDPSEVLGAFRSACDMGSAQACSQEGDLYASVGFGHQDPAKALTAYTRGCELGEAASCRRGVFHSGNDKAAALKLADHGCALQNSAMCLAEIDLYQEKGNVHDTKKALTAAEALCKREESRCDRWGQILVNDDEVPHDGQKALSLYQRACDAKNAQACAAMGLIFDAARAVPLDSVKAFAAYQKSCGSGETVACMNVAFGQLTGYGAPADEKSAASQLGDLCEKNHEDMACYDLAIATMSGRGVPKDQAKGHALLERSGNRYAEVHLAHDYALGLHGIKVDLAKAETHMENACQGAFAGACDDRDTLKTVKPSAALKLKSVPDDEPVRWCLQDKSMGLVNCHGDHGQAPKNGMQVFRSNL